MSSIFLGNALTPRRSGNLRVGPPLGLNPEMMEAHNVSPEGQEFTSEPPSLNWLPASDSLLSAYMLWRCLRVSIDSRMGEELCVSPGRTGLHP